MHIKGESLPSDIFLPFFTKMNLQTKQLSSGMKETCSTMTYGLAAPQMRTLYRFTLPDKWNVASSLSTMLSTKPPICMKLQNCSRRSWSLPVIAVIAVCLA